MDQNSNEAGPVSDARIVTLPDGYNGHTMRFNAHPLEVSGDTVKLRCAVPGKEYMTAWRSAAEVQAAIGAQANDRKLAETTVEPERHSVYNTENFPTFICNHGNWDIYTNSRGICAAIPTSEAAAIGCKASQFGDRAYVKITLPSEYARWEERQRNVPVALAAQPTGPNARVQRNENFILGRNVSLAIPRGGSTLRPTGSDLKAAANKLGISVAVAQRALTCFNEA